MIDYNTILSTTEDKMTLLQWLKKVEAALKDASATTFKVNKKGDATLTFSIEFADGSELESGEIILQQGESVQSAAIVNGHLILTLTNGDELDAGDLGGVTSFSIDASQHLIVHYQNGTTQDLGAIFSGNVNIAGNLTADSIIENMSGYTFTKNTSIYYNIEDVYAGIVKNGNKLTLVYAFNITRLDSYVNTQQIAYFQVPQAVKDALYTTQIGGYNALSYGKVIGVYTSSSNFVELNVLVEKSNVTGIVLELQGSTFNNLPLNVPTYVRIEQTFLLSENLTA